MFHLLLESILLELIITWPFISFQLRNISFEIRKIKLRYYISLAICISTCLTSLKLLVCICNNWGK
jgi:hypothetical protein